jgi:hypothetical protein
MVSINRAELYCFSIRCRVALNDQTDKYKGGERAYSLDVERAPKQTLPIQHRLQPLSDRGA